MLPRFDLLSVGRFEVKGQSIELVFPKAAVVLDPVGGVAHRLGDEPAAVNAPVDFTVEQAGGFEDAQVLGDGGERNVKGRGELADGGLAAGQAGEEGAARGVGEGAEGGVECRERIVNHTV